MAEQVWITEAKRHIGLREIKGSKHEPQILQWWKAIKQSWIKDDETPWCAGFVGGVLEDVGITSSRSAAAKSYESWGVRLSKPVPGCIVVFTRKGGGHVGFVVGKDKAGRLLVLGGNQSDAVNIKAFPLDRVTAYRWPIGFTIPNEELPVLANAELSTNEA